MLRSVGYWLACLRSPRSCAVRLVQRRSSSYRYFHMQKKSSQRETRRLAGGLLDDALLPRTHRRNADEGGR